jgi:hypothetical protein
MEKLRSDFLRFEKALRLLRASVTTLPIFEPDRVDDSAYMIPFDALSSRFERAVELASSKLLRTLELHLQQSTSVNLRERLLILEKNRFVSSVELWMEMREFRNKIAHDYLPDQISKIYDAVSARFLPELEQFYSKVFSVLKEGSNSGIPNLTSTGSVP